MLKIIIDTANDLFSETLEFLGEGFEGLFEKDKKLKASFGNASRLLSKKHKGFCVDGKRFLSIKQSQSNMLVVAPSGKGKTQVSIFPFLLTTKGDVSMIINDVSGELSKTIPYLESQGITCLSLDFGKKTGLYFNPLDGCKENVPQMKKVAKTLMSVTSTETDFFTLAGEDCISVFIEYVMQCEPKIYQNLGVVYRLLLEYQGSPKVIEKLFASKATENLWKKFKSLAGASENTRKSIVASSLSALSFIGDNPILCDITSVSNFSFETLRETSTALFVNIPVGDTKFYAPMLSLFFQEFYRFGFSRIPSEGELPIMMIMDEFDTLTAIQDFSSIISNSRKHLICQQIIIQSTSQLSKYGKNAKNILNNCNVKCFYGGLGEETFELEKTLGKFEYEDEKSKQIRQRSLMTASEIRELKNKIIVLPSGEKPLKVRITPAYKQSKLCRRLAMQIPGNKSESNPNYSIQYIDLKPFRGETNTSDEK